ncbi:cobyrinate a,c-diamide synthase [Flavivirga jejuensis]|uniref:Cobyrinate a,c-diamide synthase n=1 Tax=Flavivirga jejuensis TaxID=870487 RepID=A0ABT8WSS2_9FLAO|nr:cobyrinate a,c-diamide synthase [Flavivirga jejuensis]MDO5976206.1 cobyrinate a,c-diamide synthase [Flavivirga jejuensis]
MTKQFIIAAPNSNAGKTTITLGLLRLFKQKNIAPQPFKVGPDYIDPKFHQLACDKTGVNLDLYMMTQEDINTSLHVYSRNAQVNCIEGVMGLFDGAKKDKGSTAELAKKLRTPVLLVIDAKAVAYSVAPLIQGFVNFDKNLKIMGVIFNRVGSANHYTFLKEACEDIGVKSFGYLQNIKDIAIPSRYLGLNIEDIKKFDIVIDKIANKLEETVNWKAILEASKDIETTTVSSKETKSKNKIKFAVAKDEAFNFIYPQNIRVMQQLGDVQFFSPIHDKDTPNCDFIYFPGGYPELYLKELSSNKEMLLAIKKYAQNDGKIYAECGGMMYLGKSILSEDNETYNMVNYFNFESTIANPKLHLGYRTSEINNHSFKGHEFHYSSIINDNETSMEANIINARGGKTTTKIYKKQHVMGSYVHHYFGTTERLSQLINEINHNL